MSTDASSHEGWGASLEGGSMDKERERNAPHKRDGTVERVGTLKQCIPESSGSMGSTRDCFASRIMHKLPVYMSLNPDPNSVATNALYQEWGNNPYFFPPFCLIRRVLKILRERKTGKALLIAPLWPGQPWYSMILEMLIVIPVCLPQKKNLLSNHMKLSHPLVEKKSLHLAAFLVSGNSMKTRVFQNQLPKSCSMQDERAQQVLTKRVGTNGFCGVMNDRWISLRHL